MNSSTHGSRASIDILEELQLIAAQNLEKLDINKYYEIVRELGKGTYGKVDLVIHKIRGNEQMLQTKPIFINLNTSNPSYHILFDLTINDATYVVGISSKGPTAPGSRRV